VTGEDVPQPGESVDELLAVGVGQRGPVGLDPHVALRVVLAIVQGMDQVRLITGQEVGLCRRGRHASLRGHIRVRKES
jgi:hypothetical protein